ncbi:MAG: hypothetical protein DCC46_11415 [Armatimonadetes bacterium]|nr:MAG: hypothetical protein DCC46_11415 [Armatimonadota bacterium]
MFPDPRNGYTSVHVSDSNSNGWLILKGASGNNLQHLDAAIPVGLFTCVTGVSGSGKSTLVQDTLYPRLLYELYGTRTTWAPTKAPIRFSAYPSSSGSSLFGVGWRNLMGCNRPSYLLLALG